MPLVNVRLIEGVFTPEQKREMIHQLTETMVEIEGENLLPVGSALIVDDFQYTAPAVGGSMTDLVERWPAETAQLVLASRSDPALRLHRLRMSAELCEIRDRDLQFSLAECGDLLANFGVEVAAADLALFHRRSEGWAAELQMAALSLRGTRGPGADREGT